MQNKQIALSIPETYQVGMASAFQIERGSSVQQDKESTMVMRFLTSEGNSSLRHTSHWVRTMKR